MTGRGIIGVVCNPVEERWVREFFELFKTPWEFYRPGQTYSVVISTDPALRDLRAKLLVLYTSKAGSMAGESPYPIYADSPYLIYREIVFPIYGDTLALECGTRLVSIDGSSAAAAIETQVHGMKVVRVGYDLFSEVRFLLSRGQPTFNALMPTLDIHILMLRNWILEAGIPLVEIPPVPAGHEFIACLTHDVDFLRIRDHRFDHTMWGFIYRAVVGSLLKLAKQRISLANLLKNLRAVASLPAVHLGLCKDFWLEDFERYASLERDLKATYFFIPFKNRSGDKIGWRHARRRKALYDVTKERGLLQELMRTGNEIGVHGIDAWHDAEKGCEERRRLAEATGQSNVGIRVHWLCFDATSPRVLEEAGFQYDSTFGYNEAVGYLAGTTQVFRPEGAQNLLELPLHIEDGALFNRSYLSLEEKSAWKRCNALLRNAVTYGGVLTILWHTRSLAPERLWGNFYARLLQELRARQVWFATAGQVVDWFRSRRAVSFRSVEFSQGRLRLVIEHKGGTDVSDRPCPIIRIHIPQLGLNAAGHHESTFFDIPWNGEPVVNVAAASPEGTNGTRMVGCA